MRRRDVIPMLEMMRAASAISTEREPFGSSCRETIGKVANGVALAVDGLAGSVADRPMGAALKKGILWGSLAGSVGALTGPVSGALLGGAVGATVFLTALAIGEGDMRQAKLGFVR